MFIRWLFAAVHLLALGIGLGAILVACQSFSGTLDVAGLKRVFYADTWWGIAAILWIGTGLIRAFGGLEKGSHYDIHNYIFQAKIDVARHHPPARDRDDARTNPLAHESGTRG